MTRPLIPPRGVFVPTSVVYNRALPAAILQTWVQLRGLAWGDSETPPLSMKQLIEITGKSQSCLYGHMTSLRVWGALRWRPSGRGTFIVSFEADPDPATAAATATATARSPGSFLQDSRNLEAPDPDPLTDRSSLFNEEDLYRKFQDFGNMESRAAEFRSPHPAAGQSRGSKESNPAADRYHRKIGIYANRAQRKLLADQVSDLALWEATLEHWLSHGWNPRNVAGQLQLYGRGGPQNCPFCQKDSTPLDQTLAGLEQLRKELSNG
jgi:hypothetical protein